MTTIVDDRTEAQRKTHTCLIIATDRVLSGWGGATGGKSYAAWACIPEDRAQVLDWVERRSDMQRVRVVYEDSDLPYRPTRGCAHLHIYTVTPNHPALRTAQVLEREIDELKRQVADLTR